TEVPPVRAVLVEWTDICRVLETFLRCSRTQRSDSLMHYGGDYNPEQWDESVWQEDVRLMREAGVTMVRVGVFAWAKIQPEEGVFEWEWLDKVVGLLHENGIRVSMATATASPPPWATTKYPE